MVAADTEGVEAGLARHSENSLLAAKTTIPAEVKRQLKALKDAGKIPDMKRVENDSPSRFYPAYKQLLEHGGRPDAIWEEQTPIKELLAEEDGTTCAMGKAILAAVVDHETGVERGGALWEPRRHPDGGGGQAFGGDEAATRLDQPGLVP